MSTANQTQKKVGLPLRRGWWVTALFIVFGLLIVYILLNLVIGGQCQTTCVVNTLSQLFYWATPITFAALTGLLCERSGIVNIGIEGQMLMAAMVAYGVNLFTYQMLKQSMDPVAAGNISRWLGVIGGVI